MEQELDGMLAYYNSFDAQDWAQAFKETAVKLGYSDMDKAWLIV